MATRIRVSGTRKVTPIGSTQLSSPNGDIVLDSKSTVVSGSLVVNQDSLIAGTSIVGGEQVVNVNRNDGIISTTSVAIRFDQTANVDNPAGIPYNPNNVYGQEILGSVEAANAQRQVGAMYIPGGLGIQKDLNVGGFIYGRISEAITSTNLTVLPNNDDASYFPVFVNRLSGDLSAAATFYGDEQGIQGGLRYNPARGLITVEKAQIVSAESSTSTTTGALQVAGGVGIGGELHVDDIVTKVLSSIQSKIQIAPEPESGQDLGLTEIIGNLRVRGDKPIGTAPVVRNTLYVTMDGNDTNDGRALDPSRACRTVGGAMKSPYYDVGTQILVSAGHYYEDNPLPMKPYTSVRGSDIRTTFLEPINKTQDLFHMNSGCYLNYMTFLNGRSGLLDGPYEEGFNRGAYATAFPPLTGDERIDLFQSPYVQNCTNQSGPWLKDGTLFVPNQTVQIPKATATGSWNANTSSIIVTVTTGTISRGMSVNAGKQNKGFFDARTMMLANKDFLKEQVVGYVDKTFNSGSFTYNKTACSRDLELIVNSIATDLLYNSDSDSTFAGLQYWSQGNISTPGELGVTSAAVSYLKTLILGLISGSPGPVSDVTTLFSYIENILSSPSNLDGITDSIVGSGIPSTDPGKVSAYQTILTNRSSLINSVISWISSNYPDYSYNVATCKRDVGYMIDSVAFDLLNGGNKQSIKSGIYYYNYNSDVTQVPNEIPQVSAAYYYLKNILPSVIKGTAVPTIYQDQNSPSYVSQVISGQEVAGDYEVEFLQDKIDYITTIIRKGPAFAKNKTPMNLVKSASEEAENAFVMLVANTDFITAEVIAYIDATSSNFTYSKEKCARDVGILVENISYDASFGGNQKSVESGLAYYNGVISRIAGQEAQTIAAIDYLSNLCQKVIVNQSCPDVYAIGPVTTAEYTQVFNSSITGGAIASESISKLFEVVTRIIADGPDVIPELTVSSGPDAAYVSSEILLEANRTFIQEDTVNYINNLVKEFPYSEIKCRRDTELVVDSIAHDLLYPTSRMSQSTFAGIQYWNQGNYTGDIEAQLQPTLDAMRYLKELSGKVIRNIRYEDDLIPRYQTAVSQNVSLEPSDIETTAKLYPLFDVVTEIVSGNTTGWTDRIVTNGPASTFDNVINAFNVLQANKDYMGAEVVAYVNATHPDFTYSTSTCARDVGLIVDAISFDLVHSGNRQSVQAGFSYYQFTTSTSAIHGQSTQTVAAFNRINDVVGSILLNQPVTVTTGTVAKQIFTDSAATSAEVTKVRTAISTITSIISSGTSVAAAPSNIVMTASTVTSVINGFELLVANTTFIADEVVNYVNWNFNNSSFRYNEEKCYRDVGLIIDAVSQDIVLLGNAKSIEAGLSYWTSGYNHVAGQVNTTTVALNYAKDIALQVIANKPVTAQPQTKTKQVINPFFQYGGDYMPQQNVSRCFKIITDIIEKGPTAAPPEYGGSGLFANIGLSPDDVKSSPVVTSVSNAMYDETLCRRDSNYIIDGAYYDILLGTNYNGITSGNAYRRGIASSIAVINNELTQTKAAIEYIKSQSQTYLASSDTALERGNRSYDSVLGILTGSDISELVFSNPPSVSSRVAAKDKLIANKEFIKLEVVSWIEEQIENNVAPFANFTYDRQLCSRDTGFIIDALCYDILYGGNSAIRQCAQAYFTKDGVSTIVGESTQSVSAFQYMSAVAQNVIRGITVTPTQRNYLTQDTTGNNATAAEATTLNVLMTVITSVLTANSLAGLATLVLPSVSWAAADVDLANSANSLVSAKLAIVDNTIDLVNTLFDGTVFRVGLNKPTVGFGINATLYFGDTLIYPYRNDKVDELSYELTGSTSTWALRKVDPIGSMGGSLVDGAVISSRSPIQSFVYDAFTQVNQGGRGVHIKNDGYAQLVSVFTIFCSVGVQVESGGIASIVNSNANFGDICLLAKGYGKRQFTGHIYNPIYKAYPESPDPGIAVTFPDSEYFDQYYPTGFWPNDARVRVFLPDLEDRPHIALVMEVVAPEIVVDYTGEKVPQLNEQGFPGFLNAAPTTSTLVSGSIVLENIDTSGIAVGHSVYIRDQFGYEYDNFPYLHNSDGDPVDEFGTIVDQAEAPVNPRYLIRYADTGTIVTDLGYKSITLNKALTNGGGDPTNTEYFNIYFCGNAYYTVLSSEVGINPEYNRKGEVIPPGVNILSVEATGLETSQLAAHISSLQRLKDVVLKVIKNEAVTVTLGNTSDQVFKPLVATGGLSEQFIINRFTDLIGIVNAANITTAEYIVPPSLRNREGTVPLGAGDAISLIKDNIKFMTDEITAYVNTVIGFTPDVTYDESKCRRDVKIILERLIYDLESGGNYNCVMVGLSYWNRPGTYHVIQLGENVTRTDLFPDGATVNFYQRSYMSASGYVFEYVGAGVDYGALPQRGVADPKQGQEVVQLDSGKVFFTSTDQNGDFRIGPGLVISQATGVLSGRTFTRSLFANLTPFILAIESGAG